MLVQPPQQAATDSLRECLAAHLEPDIHLPSLTRLLDVLAHVSLLAEKLKTEIERIRKHPNVTFSARDKISLVGICATVEEAGQTLWKDSLSLRELAIAKPLLAANPKLRQIERALRSYYGPVSGNIDVKPEIPDADVDGPLFISAAPSWLVQPLAESSKQVQAWYAQVSSGSAQDSRPEMERIQLQKDDIRRSVLDAANQVFDCMDMASQIFDTYIHSHDHSVKHKPHEARTNIARDDAASKAPRRSLPIHFRDEKPSEIENPSPAQRARLDTPNSDGQARRLGDPDKATAVIRTIASSREDRTEGGHAASPRILAKPIAKPTKKRGRPSFPPREGPNYMRTVPTAAPDAKRQRMHPFQSTDMKRR